MSKKFLLSMALASLAPVAAMAAPITFDNGSTLDPKLPTDGTSPVSYLGLTFYDAFFDSDGTSVGFVSTNSTTAPLKIVVDVPGALNANSLKLSFKNSNNLIIDVTGVGGKTDRFTLGATPGSGGWAEEVVFEDFGELIKQVAFSSTTNGRNTVSLDNLDFYLVGDNGGTVPEPAGYALAGLALLAAGGATRRRAR